MPRVNPLEPPFDFGTHPWEIAGPLGSLETANEKELKRTAGYRFIQAEQVLAAQRTYADFPVHVNLWYECLTLVFEAIDGLETISVQERPALKQEARTARFYIFAQHAGVSKVGLDTAMTAMYAPALWSIRNVLEAAWHMGYLRLRPEEGLRWYLREGVPESSNQLPSEKKTFNLVKSEAGKDYSSYYEQLWEIHGQANKGSHPSKELFGLPLSRGQERFSVGPNYLPVVAERILTRGVTAATALLYEFSRTEPCSIEWMTCLVDLNRQLQELLTE